MALLACSSLKIPNIRVFKEIPFVDGREGVYVETVTKNFGVVQKDEWAKRIPYMIMLDPEGWTEIKKSWLKACRMVKDKKCNIEVESVDTVIRKIDDITRSIVTP